MLNIRRWRGRALPYAPGETGVRHVAAAGQNPPAVIVGKLAPRRRVTGIESAFLRAHAPGPYKITIPSPTWYLRGYIKGTSDAAYPTPGDALRDLTAIVRAEVAALVGEGVPYVQVDSIRYVFDYTDDERRREWQELGIDPDAAVEENVAADNAVVAGLPRGNVTLGLHMCRGNNRSRWFAEGGYDRIAARVFPPAGLRPLPARVRQRPRRRLRAPPPRAPRQDRGARAHLDQGAPARVARRLAAPDRGGRALRADGAPRAEPAVRLRVGGRGQRDLLG